MKILFFSHYFPPEVNAPATRTYEHCRRWVRDGHSVTVVTCQPNCPTGRVFDGYKNRLWPEVDEVDGIRVIRCWTLLAANAGFVRRSLNYFSFMITAVFACLLQQRPDIIVATSPQFFAGWAGIFAGFLRWRPCVLEVRDVWPQSIEAVGAMRSRPLLLLLVLLEHLMYRLSTHIVTVGPGYRTHIENRLAQPSCQKVTVITNGVDLARFQPSEPDEAFLAKHDLNERFVCCYVGTIGLAHGLDVVLRAAAILKRKGRHDIAFCMVGDGARRERLEKLAKHLGVESWVRFLGICPKTDIPRVIASSGAMLVHLKGCELFETVIPSKIFEIMAMQRPIIMGVSGEAYRIVDEAHAGLPMTPDSEDDLVRILELLCDGPELAAELSEAGRKFVATYYNRDALASEFLELLQHIAAGSRKLREAAPALAPPLDNPHQEQDFSSVDDVSY